jgi:ApaG protein
MELHGLAGVFTGGIDFWRRRHDRTSLFISASGKARNCGFSSTCCRIPAFCRALLGYSSVPEAHAMQTTPENATDTFLAHVCFPSRLRSKLSYMTDRTPYRAITRGIAVSVEPSYLEANSSPDSSQYVWAYRVTIENQGTETVQLLSRHWMITNARGELTEVKGPGVIGRQPVLEPGESYTYTSGAPLNTPSGMMGGAYQMESESGERFDIEIPTFSLDSPQRRGLLN